MTKIEILVNKYSVEELTALTKAIQEAIVWEATKLISESKKMIPIPTRGNRFPCEEPDKCFVFR